MIADDSNDDRTAEAGRYLEIYKTFERKPPDMIKERVENDHMSHLSAALTSVKGVNKTDVLTLASNFGVGPSHSRRTESAADVAFHRSHSSRSQPPAQRISENVQDWGKRK